MNLFTPAEIVSNYIGTGESKVNNKVSKMFVLAILSGLFIGFGAAASSTTAHNIANGSCQTHIRRRFPVGLIMVVLLGAELFTAICSFRYRFAADASN